MFFALVTILPFIAIFLLSVSLTIVNILVILPLLIMLFYFLAKFKKIKVVSVNILIFFVSLFLIESFLVSSNTIKNLRKKNDKQIFTVFDRATKEEINNSKSYTKTLYKNLGSGPMPNSIINSKKIKNGEVVYDVNYTIDKDGHRITSNFTNNKNSKKSVLFFGCSFTYGEGVFDIQSLPYVFHENMKNEYDVYNFGFSGYGAHQMLVILENDLEKQSINNHKPIKHVFYQAILDHIRRAKLSKDLGYELSDDGNLYFAKAVDVLEVKKEPNKSLLDKYILNVKNNSRSFILNRVLSKFPSEENQINDEKITDRDRDLFLKIVEKSRNIVYKKYKSDFTVILWDLIKNNNELVAEDSYNLSYITKGLDRMNIKYILISDILLDHKNDSEKYTIKGDGHPSALSHKEIAKYISNAIY